MSTERNNVVELFKAPLMAAIAHRRARRFPLGCKIPDRDLRYVSEKSPVPLNNLELAFLCWAGNGVTGTITGDLPISGGNLFTTWLGRAVPYACNVQNTRLFFTSDNGTYVYHPDTSSGIVEVEGEKDWQKITEAYQKGLRKVMDERAEFVPKSLLRAMHWNTNQPGTTIFIPIIDQTMEYINFLLGLFDYEGYGYQLFDEQMAKWAGLSEWISSGNLKGPKVDLRSFEQTLLTLNLAPAYMMLQDIHLVAEAMGLGSVVFGGYIGTVMLGVTPQSRGLGFRAATDKAGKTNAVGLDSVFEAFCPPYYRDMGEAVDAFVEMKFGRGGLFSTDYKGKTPYKNWPQIQPKFHHPSKTSIDQVKAVCRYVYETYGRFPASSDTKVIPMWLQVHHLELDFYREHYPPEMVTEAHRQHMALWHKD